MGSERCKVDKIIDAYDIDATHGEFEDVDEELLALWKGDGDYEARGYRSLAEWLNKQLLRSAYERNDRLVLEPQLDNEFDVITGDDEIARGELLDKLEQAGVDGDALSNDMVSFSTVRRHLTECLDGTKKRQEAETDWEETSVEIATDRLVQKVEKALSSFESKGEVEGASDADISVQIQLSCPECATRRTLRDALRLGFVCETHLGADDSTATVE